MKVLTVTTNNAKSDLASERRVWRCQLKMDFLWRVKMRRMFSAMLACVLACGLCFSMAGCGSDDAGTGDDTKAAETSD